MLAMIKPNNQAVTTINLNSFEVSHLAVPSDSLYFQPSYMWGEESASNEISEVNQINCIISQVYTLCIAIAMNTDLPRQEHSHMDEEPISHIVLVPLQ